MKPRPQASWVGPPPERVGMPHAGVGISRGLPPSLGFGALSPSITTGSPFSGAVAPRGMNVVHPEPPPTFQAPSYGNIGNPMQPSHIAPLIAALMATGAAAPTSRPTTIQSPPAAPSPWSQGVSQGVTNTAITRTAAPVTQGGGLIPALTQKTSPYGSNFIKAY
jgi:hypothetical protein